MGYIYIYIYNGILLSHKKEQNNGICSNMDRPRDYHVKSDRKRQISYDITHMWNLKYDTNELIYKAQTHKHKKKTSLWLIKGIVERGGQQR